MLENVEGRESFWQELDLFLFGALLYGMRVSSVSDYYSSFDVCVFHGFSETVYAVDSYRCLSRDAPHQGFLFFFRYLYDIANRVFVLLLLNQLVASKFDQYLGFAFFKTDKFFTQTLNPHGKNIRNLNYASTLKPCALRKAKNCLFSEHYVFREGSQGFSILVNRFWRVGFDRV